jgi:hypothetical protein
MTEKMFDLSSKKTEVVEEDPHLEVGEVVEFLGIPGPKMVVLACWGPKNNYAVDVLYVDSSGVIQKCCNIDERILNWATEGE